MNIDVVNSGTNNVGIFLGYGNGSFTNQTTYSTGSSLWFISIGDFNNDTRPDIVVANGNDSNVCILLRYGNGSFTKQSIYSTGFNSQPYSVTVNDFNNDTFSDIIVANNGSNNVVILLGYSDGTFEDLKVLWISYGSLPFSVIANDFNNDKKLDFAVANYDADSLNILLQTC
jgi:hypothetical protein